MLEIGSQVMIKLEGTIVRAEGGYTDDKIRYFIQCDHCVSATVTTDQIISTVPTLSKSEVKAITIQQ